MNHRQIEKIGMYKKMHVFFSNLLYSVIWASFNRFVDEVANFVNLNTTLSNHIQNHHADTKGFKNTKDNAFLAMVLLLVNKAQRAYVWAMDNNNEKLAGIFDVTKSDIYKKPEMTGYAMVKNVRDALNENIASMASVQLGVADILTLDAAIAIYQNTIGTTGAAQSHKTANTMGIDDMILPIDKSLGIIDRLIESTYAESHPDMLKEYWLNRNIEKLPTYHSGIYAHITDAATGSDLQGAILAVNGKSSTSDIDGVAEIIKIRPGTYNATIQLTGYAEQNIKVVITRGKILDLEVKLAK